MPHISNVQCNRQWFLCYPRSAYKNIYKYENFAKSSIFFLNISDYSLRQIMLLYKAGYND